MVSCGTVAAEADEEVTCCKKKSRDPRFASRFCGQYIHECQLSTCEHFTCENHAALAEDRDTIPRMWCGCHRRKAVMIPEEEAWADRSDEHLALLRKNNKRAAFERKYHDLLHLPAGCPACLMGKRHRK